MTPSARIQAAIEILEALSGTPIPADRFIRDWFAATERYATQLHELSEEEYLQMKKKEVARQGER